MSDEMKPRQRMNLTVSSSRSSRKLVALQAQDALQLPPQSGSGTLTRWKSSEERLQRVRGGGDHLSQPAHGCPIHSFLTAGSSTYSQANWEVSQLKLLVDSMYSEVFQMKIVSAAVSTASQKC